MPHPASMSEWTHERLTERIVEILRDDILEVGPEFDRHTDLVGAGLGSLTVTQLLLAIEEATGVWVDESLLTPENLASAEHLAGCVYEQLGGG